MFTGYRLRYGSRPSSAGVGLRAESISTSQSSPSRRRARTTCSGRSSGGIEPKPPPRRPAGCARPGGSRARSPRRRHRAASRARACAPRPPRARRSRRTASARKGGASPASTARASRSTELGPSSTSSRPGAMQTKRQRSPASQGSLDGRHQVPLARPLQAVDAGRVPGCAAALSAQARRGPRARAARAAARAGGRGSRSWAGLRRRGSSRRFSR